MKEFFRTFSKDDIIDAILNTHYEESENPIDAILYRLYSMKIGDWTNEIMILRGKIRDCSDLINTYNKQCEILDKSFAEVRKQITTGDKENE